MAHGAKGMESKIAVSDQYSEWYRTLARLQGLDDRKPGSRKAFADVLIIWNRLQDI
jgi:hypothetical protein